MLALPSGHFAPQFEPLEIFCLTLVRLRLLWELTTAGLLPALSLSVKLLLSVREQIDEGQEQWACLVSIQLVSEQSHLLPITALEAERGIDRADSYADT